MKTLLAFLIAMNFYCSNVFAQFKIDSNFNPVPGNEEVYWNIDTKNIHPGKDGEKIIWDFSKISLQGDSDVTVYTISSITPFYKDFPLSNVASFNPKYNSYVYYKISNDSWISLGNGYKMGVEVYSKPEVLMQYPLSYNNSFTSDFNGSGNSSEYKMKVCGTFIVKCDAYGTIILPSGKSDVIRIKSISSYFDTLYQDNKILSANHMVSTTYRWFKKDYKFPIFYFDETVSDNGLMYSAGYVKNSTTIDNNQLKVETY